VALTCRTRPTATPLVLDVVHMSASLCPASLGIETAAGEVSLDLAVKHQPSGSPVVLAVARRVAEVAPESFRLRRGPLSKTLLQRMLEHCRNPAVVTLVIGATERASPDAFGLRPEQRQTFLSMALLRGWGGEVVDALLERTPEPLIVKGGSGRRTPLLLAMEHVTDAQAVLKILRMAVACDDSVLSTPDGNGWLPVHAALWRRDVGGEVTDAVLELTSRLCPAAFGAAAQGHQLAYQVPQGLRLQLDLRRLVPLHVAGAALAAGRCENSALLERVMALTQEHAPHVMHQPATEAVLSDAGYVVNHVVGDGRPEAK